MSRISATRFEEDQPPLAVVVQSLPQLQKLCWAVTAASGVDGPMQFPLRLTLLYLRFDSNCLQPVVAAAFEALCSLCSLHTLHLELNRVSGSIVDFPWPRLASLPSLRQLVVPQVLLSHAANSVLRRMSGLEALRSRPHMMCDDVTELTAEGHALRLQQLYFPYLHDEILPNLLSLPTLTALRAPLYSARSLRWLNSLPALTQLSIQLTGGDVSGMLAGVDSKPLLTDLSLEKILFSPLELQSLLSLLPCLARLHIDNAPALDSFALFAASPLQATLQQFVLQKCRLVPLAQTVHLRSLRHLRVLQLLGSCDPRMSQEEQAWWSPPCPALPMLRRFQYTPVEW